MSEGNGYAAGAAFVDGRYVPIAEASIPILDWGFLRGDATYDVVHVWDGAFFRLDEHLDRFERSIARLFYSIPYGRDAIAETLHRCVALAGLRDAFVEMLVTRGMPRNRDPRTAENRFAVFAIPFVWILPPERRDAGLHLVISSIERIRSQAVDPTVKNYHWLDLVRGLYEAYDRGGETAALVDAEGHVLEGPGFNLYAVADGAATTPGEGVLEGVTRGTAAELLRRRDVPVAMRPLHADELRAADEVFVTSTAGGIMPITAIDGGPVGGGAVGPITARLIDDYWAAHRSPEWSTPVRYELASAASASPSAP
jgi:branched-chain amino acid aminotransferase